jgi:hypothetical protein
MRFFREPYESLNFVADYGSSDERSGVSVRRRAHAAVPGDGRRGRPPLIYEHDGDRFVVVASKGGAPTHPDWYRNLEDDPNVELQVLDDVFPARGSNCGGRRA